jgi:hypothetical protein
MLLLLLLLPERRWKSFRSGFFLFICIVVVTVQYLDWMLYTPVLYIYEGINPLISRVSSFSVSMTTYR